MEIPENYFDFDYDGKPLHKVINSSSNKTKFFDKAISRKREISAFHLNDVFCEFSDLFYKGLPYKNAMANFKIYMNHSAKKHSLKIYKMPVGQMDRSEYSIRSHWSFIFS